MKRLALFLILLIPTIIYSQPCLPAGYTFNAQSQVDNFQADFPNCTEIEGNVTIRGADITNLNGLNVLTSIGGSLSIYENHMMSDLNGLDNLTAVGGYLLISNNNTLTSLSGLGKLSSVSGFCNITSNALLTTLTGLDNLQQIGSLEISNNPELSSLTGLGNLVKIEGIVSVTDNAALSSFSGLTKLDSIGGTFYITGNEKITSLNGLNNLKTIGGDIDIPLNDALTNFSGFENLTAVGGHIWIADNAALTSLTGFDNLLEIGGYLMLKFNTQLTNIDGLKNIQASSIDSLLIIDNYLLSTCEIKSVCDFLQGQVGKIIISNNATGCNSNEEVEEACKTGFMDDQTALLKIKVTPNPFTTTTSLSYTLQQPSKVSLGIYNHLGQLIYQVQENQAQGKRQLIWNAEGFAEGVYYYRLKAGDAVSNGKMVKVR